MSKPNRKPAETPTEVTVKPEPFKAYSLIRSGCAWTVVEVTIEGDKVISRTETTPNVRMIAQNDFKVKVAKELFSGDR